MVFNLGGAESLQIFGGRANSVSQMDGVSDMAPACWLCGSVVGGFRKGAMASALLNARHFISFPYATGTFQAGLLVLELKGSECE